VSIYVLLRLYFSVFGESAVFDRLPMPEIFLLLSIAAMFLASVAAAFQDNLKHMLAYSSIAQIGYITLGIGLANQAGLTGSIVHLFNHGLTKCALFLLAGCFVFRLRSVRFVDLAGIGRTMPLTTAGVVIGGLSLVGVPGTAGFVTKWYLVLGGLEAGSWALAFAPVLSSLIALWYVWRFVETAYFRTPSTQAAAVGEAPAVLLVPALALAAACIYFGFDTSFTVGAASRAAAGLLPAP
jgi:multicomponent Na+:H+ antiporter subunit D